MNDIYILMLLALGFLAVVDLVVGVSNDAVNFLNSAIGSKAIKYRNIMIIASLGVFLGAATSSGMMEIARSGIFIPSEFYFNEVMYIFMAVMITDILLLDVFNTLGLPTSTTVSIVFELLGAAVVMALIKISVSDVETVSYLAKYINSAKALEIIMGILLSVVIAFTVGSLVMYFSRLIFSFYYESNKNYINAIFGGIAITAITYFIIIKGIKGSDYYKDIKVYIEGYQYYIIFGSLIFWTLAGYLLSIYTKFNILKFVIGMGTFSLALAFAGNDLVNFIGVPITALDSYLLWHASGESALTFKMGGLMEGIKTQNGLLFLAGLIMVLTLWFSKKAQHVTETEINLARQGEGAEKFKPNELSRIIVRGASKVNDFFGKFIPEKTSKFIEERFTKPVIKLPLERTIDLPAFDQVRASVNLVVAAILISMATSLKLPLSTTYVTFMVAMGSSLADRAWGLESAVYRVAGVLNVIAGWFVTAITAFLVAGLFVYLINLGGIVAIAVLLILVFGIIFKNSISFQKKQKDKKIKELKLITTNRTISHVIDESSDHIAEIIKRVKKLYANTYKDLSNHDLNKLKKNKKHVDILDEEVSQLKDGVFYYIKSLDDHSIDGSKFYILIVKYIQDISQSINYISTSSFVHVNNNHKKLKKSQLEDLQKIDIDLLVLLEQIEVIFHDKSFEKLEELIHEKRELFNYIEDLINSQVNRIRTEDSSPKNSMLYFGILLESKDMIDAIFKMLELFTRFQISKKEI